MTHLNFDYSQQSLIQKQLGSSLKTFVFQNQSTYQSQNVELPIPADATEIDIRQIIDSFKQKHLIFMPLEWKVYDPETFNYKIIDIQKPLPQIFLCSSVIMLKYREVNLPDSDCDSVNSKGQSEMKKQRNKERTIRQVIQHVKHWRQIHNTLDKYKNKINLYDAAKTVGIAKKSLDDYFCQLRLAEQLGFNFEQNMNEKIGILRSYVRKHRPKGQNSLKHERLPRKLRIIEQFGMQSTSIPKQPIQKMQMMQEQPLQTMIQSQYEPPMPSIPEDQLQNRFFSSFNFMIDDPHDPFINYGLLRSNSLKQQEVDPTEFLFF